ncbi:MAG: class I SAM-dependent methyltransferase [Deltaproteobacteria bacterium]|nr:class I SAM-dependent methyltransferase [Deltaproteobacteria bacterium]
MDKITTAFKEHHSKLFEEHGATPLGVDWKDERELLFRYSKMLAVLDKDFLDGDRVPTLLDVGCGYGGLLTWATEQGIQLDYTGIDIVESMVASGRERHPSSRFIAGDVLELDASQRYDFVVCNGTLTQKLAASSIDMEAFARKLVRRMFDLANHGIAWNLMSNRVNFTVANLYYTSPTEWLAWCLGELSPRVRIDHGYSSLANGRGKYYDYTLYVYKD